MEFEDQKTGTIRKVCCKRKAQYIISKLKKDGVITTHTASVYSKRGKLLRNCRYLEFHIDRLLEIIGVKEGESIDMSEIVHGKNWVQLSLLYGENWDRALHIHNKNTYDSDGRSRDAKAKEISFEEKLKKMKEQSDYFYLNYKKELVPLQLSDVLSRYSSQGYTEEEVKEALKRVTNKCSKKDCQPIGTFDSYFPTVLQNVRKDFFNQSKGSKKVASCSTEENFDKKFEAYKNKCQEIDHSQYKTEAEEREDLKNFKGPKRRNHETIRKTYKDTHHLIPKFNYNPNATLDKTRQNPHVLRQIRLFLEDPRSTTLILMGGSQAMNTYFINALFNDAIMHDERDFKYANMEFLMCELIDKKEMSKYTDDFFLAIDHLDGVGANSTRIHMMNALMDQRSVMGRKTIFTMSSTPEEIKKITGHQLSSKLFKEDTTFVFIDTPTVQKE
jgi:hypothetical protein